MIVRNEQGYMFMVVLIIVVVFSVLGTAFFTILYSEIQQTRWHEEGAQAYYYARSGVEVALARILEGDIDDFFEDNKEIAFVIRDFDDLVYEDVEGEEALRGENPVEVSIQKTKEDDLDLVTEIVISSWGRMGEDQQVKKVELIITNPLLGFKTMSEMGWTVGRGQEGVLIDTIGDGGEVEIERAEENENLIPVLFVTKHQGGVRLNRDEANFEARGIHVVSPLTVHKSSNLGFYSDTIVFYEDSDMVLMSDGTLCLHTNQENNTEDGIVHFEKGMTVGGRDLQGTYGFMNSGVCLPDEVDQLYETETPDNLGIGIHVRTEDWKRTWR